MGKKVRLKAGDVLLGRFLLGAKLGEGAYGQVFCSTDLRNGRQVAVKASFGRHEIRTRNEGEAALLRRLSTCPLNRRDGFVVLLQESHVVVGGRAEKDDCVVLVLELMAGNLTRTIASGYFDDWQKVRGCARRLARILCYLRDVNVVHADIKPDNILVGKGVGTGREGTEGDRTFKFADFGLAHCPGLTEKSHFVQTLPYRAPEVLLGYDYDCMADVWSVGCVLFQCLLGKQLFQVKDELDLFQKIVMILGTPPQHVIARAPNRDRFFVLSATIDLWVVKGFVAPVVPMGLDGFIRQYHGVEYDGRVAADFLDLVGRMLKVYSHERCRPEECLGHAFLAEAIPRPDPVAVPATVPVRVPSPPRGALDGRLLVTSRLCSSLGLGKSIADEAANLLARLKLQFPQSDGGGDSTAVTCACIHLVCRKWNFHVPLESFYAVTGVPLESLANAVRAAVAAAIQEEKPIEEKRTETAPAPDPRTGVSTPTVIEVFSSANHSHDRREIVVEIKNSEEKVALEAARDRPEPAAEEEEKEEEARIEEAEITAVRDGTSGPVSAADGVVVMETAPSKKIRKKVKDEEEEPEVEVEVEAEVAQLCAMLGLQHSVEERTLRVYRKVVAMASWGRTRRKTIVSACLYMAAQAAGIKRSFGKICQASRLGERGVTRFHVKLRPHAAKLLEG